MSYRSSWTRRRIWAATTPPVHHLLRNLQGYHFPVKLIHCHLLIRLEHTKAAHRLYIQWVYNSEGDRIKRLTCLHFFSLHLFSHPYTRPATFSRARHSIAHGAILLDEPRRLGRRRASRREKMIIMNYLVYSGIRLKKSKSISLSLCWTSQSLISTVSKRHIEKRPLNFIRTGTMEMSRQLRNYLQRFSLHIRSFLTRRSEHGIIRIGKFSWGARPRQGAIISITHGWQRQTIS